MIPSSGSPKVTVSRKEKLLTGHNKGHLNHALRLSDEKIRKGEVWRLVSSALLHVGTFHILTNAAAFLIVGYVVETQIGAVKTLLCYLASAFISGLFMGFVYHLHDGEGASPGIYGLIAVFVILAVKNRTILFSGVPVALLVVLAVYKGRRLFRQQDHPLRASFRPCRRCSDRFIAHLKRLCVR